MPSVYTAEVWIDAPVERVWQVLTDFGRYSEWNPFTPAVKTTGVIGDPVRITVAMPVLRGRTFPQVEELREIGDGRLVWGARFPAGVIVAERVQTVTPEGSGTRYRTVDEIGGPMAWVPALMFGSSLRTGFQQVADSLKREAERR